MSARNRRTLTLLACITAAVVAAGCIPSAAVRQPPRMKMTTPIPPGIATPDRLDTRLGTLRLFDGVPDEQTAQKVYDNLDFQRGVQAYLSSIQIASMYGMRKGILEFGPANTTALLFETLMDSKALWLTPNTTSVYMTSWLEMKDEPMVIETPPKMTFINVSGKFNNTIHRMDYGIFEEINEVVQAEPAESGDPEILGMLASIGIKKGQPFKPDARMKKILAEAADVGAATVRTLAARPRDDMYYFYPGKGVWSTPFPGGSHEFLDNGARVLDARAYFHFYATGITPAMTAKMVGKGLQYAVAYMDADGNPFDGGKTYKVHLPPNVPAKDFWSFTLYDNQTRAMLQTDQQFPGLDGNKKGLKQNADGSFDVYFGPQPPAGKEANWIQTVPGKGWNMLFRLYGPLKPWFDKTWRPSDPEVVE